MVGPLPECADLYDTRSPLKHAGGFSSPVVFFQVGIAGNKCGEDGWDSLMFRTYCPASSQHIGGMEELTDTWLRLVGLVAMTAGEQRGVGASFCVGLCVYVRIVGV